MGLKLWQQHIGGDSDVVQEQWRLHTQMWSENSGGNTLMMWGGNIGGNTAGQTQTWGMDSGGNSGIY